MFITLAGEHPVRLSGRLRKQKNHDHLVINIIRIRCVGVSRTLVHGRTETQLLAKDGVVIFMRIEMNIKKFANMVMKANLIRNNRGLFE